ncbi:hypothetical protein EMIHUDRAFT_439820 [Emiliania huxleyi CCMP1516]|uniref:Fe2OG dioxygenase domain-containing protein n=2 Tax=Emiliania huxleyi TaxID=2903 RepID=A0A0D3KVR5_EMIH1|nr:hypothetical protein EMIHUDRAFT_439820 [Emiliania huxleyi CCMP1516]EOD39850.1 hypothetical protein EMIHUDRAFT_439820 [Emiliania huxleyi CCMP1516]|eukprot:XP_005792279.1 hypothetical protein EMIHUDRAFT_439820 [Emiliania huxleyi CCMP1516]
MMKRDLKDVTREYASDLRRSGEKKMKGEHVVEILTRQHGGRYPVAMNDGTRPTVCGALREALGKAPYDKLCLPPKKGDFIVPELPSDAAPDVVAAPPSLEALYMRFPDNAADLLRDGALLVQLLSPAEVSTVLHQLSTQKTDKKAPRRLDHSQGNGYAGEYADLTKPLPDLLQRCQDAAREWLIDHAGPLCEVKRKEKRGGTDVTVTMSGEDALDKSKALLLRYGLGGINFAHRDSCGDFQALLLLSQPGVDYTGGEFYLADANPPFETQPFPFAAAGELLLFRGRQGHGAVEWKHGMQEVKAGSAKVTRRVAVGFFQ